MKRFFSSLYLPLSFLILSPFTQAQTVVPNLGSEWIGTPRWMWGVTWGENLDPIGGETFFRSIGKGRNFLGSSIPNTAMRPIEIRFNGDSSKCSFFVQNTTWQYNGTGIFGGSAWDMTDPLNPVRLNLCIVEYPVVGTPNKRWDPDGSAIARREYVLVMGSTYDSTGLAYAGKQIIQDAPNLDIMYVWYPRVQNPYTLFESSGTLKIFPLRIAASATPATERVTLNWTFLDNINDVDRFRIHGGTTFPPPVLDSVDNLTTNYLHAGLPNHVKHYYRIDAVKSDGSVLASGPELDATPDSTLQLLGRWAGRSQYAGIWGYTEAGSGKEYALICSQNQGVSIVDIDANPPAEVGFMPGGADCKEVKVYKQYAITCNESSPAQIYDMTKISAPKLVATAGTGSHTHNVYKDYLILNGGDVLTGFDLYSILDPTTPVKIGQYRNYYFHDTGIRNDTLAGAGIFGQGIDFVDISDPTNPRQINQFTYPAAGPHGIDFSPDGKYIYVNNEINGEPWGKIFDVSDLNNVSMVSQMIEAPNTVSHNGYYRDGFYYLAYYTEGVTVWDVRDPYNPIRVAKYDTYTGGNSGYSGCWTVYPYFASERLIASDRTYGLFVLRFKSPSTDVDDEQGNGTTPSTFTLHQNYPNPFNPTTTLSFDLARGGDVKLIIYNAIGQRVTTLVDERLPAGNHSRQWDGTSSSGKIVGTGTYFAVMESGGTKSTRKMVFVK